jgi:dTDP-glucose 4,6-dehydratase
MLVSKNVNANRNVGPARFVGHSGWRTVYVHFLKKTLVRVQKMSTIHYYQKQVQDTSLKYLVLGSKGFIGAHLVKYLKRANQIVIEGPKGIETFQQVQDLLGSTQPDRVVCSIGRTHKTPTGTIDELEGPDQWPDMVLANQLLPVWIAQATNALKIPMLYIGTGCIYEYNGLAHSIDGVPFAETDAPNFFGSAYSRVKSVTDQLMGTFANVINARIRMPITDFESPRDFITKIKSYSTIYSVPNSMTVLPNILPILLCILHDGHFSGTFNAVNVGPMSHVEVLDTFDSVVSPNGFHEYKLVGSEDKLGLKSKRSNNHLSCNKLLRIWSDLRESTVQLFQAKPLLPLRQAIVEIARLRKPKKILVTGGLGFIGSHFIESLFEDPSVQGIYNVDSLDVGASEDNVDLSKLPKTIEYEWIHMDIASARFEEHMEAFMRSKEITHVVHFAAKTHVDTSFDGIQALEYTRTNVLGTHKLIEATRRYIQKNPEPFLCFLHISTDEVYGETVDHEAHENSLLNPTNPYAATKAAAEFILKAYGTSFRFPWKMVRCNNVYGAHQFHDKVVPKFIRQAVSGGPITIHGNGSAKRMFVHESDVCNAIQTVLRDGSLFEVYNVGSNFEISVLELAQRIIRVVSAKTHPFCAIDIPIQFVEDRPFNDARYAVNDTKLRSLGWKPTKDFQAELVRLVEAFERREFAQQTNH